MSSNKKHIGSIIGGGSDSEDDDEGSSLPVFQKKPSAASPKKVKPKPAAVEVSEDEAAGEDEEEPEPEVIKKKKKRKAPTSSDDEEGHLHRRSLQDLEDEEGLFAGKPPPMRTPKSFTKGFAEQPPPKKQKQTKLPVSKQRKANPLASSDEDEEGEAAHFRVSGRDAQLIKLMRLGMVTMRVKLKEKGLTWSKWICSAGARDHAIGYLTRSINKTNPKLNAKDAQIKQLLW